MCDCQHSIEESGGLGMYGMSGLGDVQLNPDLVYGTGLPADTGGLWNPAGSSPSSGINWGSIITTGFNTGFKLAADVFSPKPTFSQVKGPNGVSSTQVWGGAMPVSSDFSSLLSNGSGGGMGLGTMLLIGAVVIGGFAMMGSGSGTKH